MAEAPVHEMSRECATMLTVAREQGGSIATAALQESLGVGHDDLERILEQLRESGMAVEESPGMWTGGDGPAPASERADAGPRVRVSTQEERAEPDEPEGPLSEALTGMWSEPEPTVRLTRPITDALSDEAIGQMVKAGLSSLDADDTFRMEIVP